MIEGLENIDLLRVVSDAGIVMKPAGAGRHVGLCPFHADHSPSFFVFDDNHYRCFGCNESGDAIEFVKKHYQESFTDAISRLGLSVSHLPEGHVETPKIRGQIPEVRGQGLEVRGQRSETGDQKNEIWEERANRFVAWCHEAILKDHKALAWLRIRGINKDTVKAFRLGINPGEEGHDIWRPRESWGLPTELKADGKPKRLWLPRGIVIPNLLWLQRPTETQDVVATRIRIRRFDDTGPKYYVVPGSDMKVLVAPGATDRAYLVVESELDAIAVHQAAGDLVKAIGLGSAATKPNEPLMFAMNVAALVLVALDFDDPGLDASWWWLNTFSNAVIHPVPSGKDPGEAVKEGINLREWVRLGLPWEIIRSIRPIFEGNKELEGEAEEKGESSKFKVRSSKLEEKSDQDRNVLESAIAKLTDLLKKHPVVIHHTWERTVIRESPRWMADHWEVSGRISELVFATPGMLDWLDLHGCEIIGGVNIGKVK